MELYWYWEAFAFGCAFAIIGLILLPLIGRGLVIDVANRIIERAAIPFLVGCALLFWLLQDRTQSEKIDRIAEDVSTLKKRSDEFEIFEAVVKNRMDDPEKWNEAKKKIEEFRQKQSQQPR